MTTRLAAYKRFNQFSFILDFYLAGIGDCLGRFSLASKRYSLTIQKKAAQYCMNTKLRSHTISSTVNSTVSCFCQTQV